MNTFVAEVIQLLKSNFTSSLGGISPVPLPPSALFPYMTVQEITGKEIEHLGGISEVQQTIIQVNVWAKDFESAGTMRDSAKYYLLGFKGTAGSRVIQGVNHVVDSMLHDGVRSLHQGVTRVMVTWG